MDEIIKVNDLIFEYPGVRALNSVSLSIRRGSITALVGPNGAGKTTLLRCLAALDEPISGSITFDGVDVLQNPRACRRNFGYLSDFFGLYEDLTVEKCLTYMAMAHGLPEETWTDAVTTAARRVGINDRLHEKAGALSRGLRQRLAIAQAIIHEPKMLMLDEPASGLDPEARASLSTLFLKLRDQGMTLMVSSHIIAELEEYSTDMLILRSGTVVSQRSLAAKVDAPSYIEVILAEPDERLATVLGGIPGVTDVRLDGSRARFLFTGDAIDRHGLLKSLLAHELTVCSFTDDKTDMQQEYLAAVRHDGKSKGGQA